MTSGTRIAPEPFASPLIAQIADLKIHQKLDQGEFRSVFLACHTVLERMLAIQIPHALGGRLSNEGSWPCGSIRGNRAHDGRRVVAFLE